MGAAYKIVSPWLGDSIKKSQISVRRGAVAQPWDTAFSSGIPRHGFMSSVGHQKNLPGLKAKRDQSPCH